MKPPVTTKKYLVIEDENNDRCFWCVEATPELIKEIGRLKRLFDVTYQLDTEKSLFGIKSTQYFGIFRVNNCTHRNNHPEWYGECFHAEDPQDLASILGGEADTDTMGCEFVCEVTHDYIGWDDEDGQESRGLDWDCLAKHCPSFLQQFGDIGWDEASNS